VTTPFTLGEPVPDVPRFDGDTILCGTTYDVLRDDVLVARSYEHPFNYASGIATVSMRKIAWAGPQPEVLSPDACLFYDLNSRFTTATETLPMVIEAVERIIKWRAEQVAA